MLVFREVCEAAFLRNLLDQARELVITLLYVINHFIDVVPQCIIIASCEVGLVDGSVPKQ